jgi:hypothetical protein
MDNNPIQCTENPNELSVRNSEPSGGLERFFVDTTNALGVWPISLCFSCLAVWPLVSLVDAALSSGSAVYVVLLVAANSWLVGICMWIVLSWFRWPLHLKVILSIWGSILAGLMVFVPIFKIVDLTIPGSFVNSLFSKACFLTLILPSATVSLIALLPYFYGEHLRSKTCLLNASKPLLEEGDGREQA